MESAGQMSRIATTPRANRRMTGAGPAAGWDEEAIVERVDGVDECQKSSRVRDERDYVTLISALSPCGTLTSDAVPRSTLLTVDLHVEQTS